jgi:hypothetical protein
MSVSYFTPVRSNNKLEYASIVWISVTSTDANKLERIQQKFAALCFNRFSFHVHYSYAYILEQLELHTLRKRRYHIDAPFPFLVYRVSKYCPLLETVGLRAPARCIMDFSLFSVCSSSKNYPSARCASSAKVCRDVKVFGTKTASFNHIL